MSNKSTSTSDQIIGPPIALAAGPFSISLVFNPDHAPNLTESTLVMGWENAAAAARIFFLWDERDIPCGWYFAGAGTNFAYSGPTVLTFQPGTWFTYGFNYGAPVPGGGYAAFANTILNGQTDTGSDASDPTAASDAQISLWMDVLSADGARGQIQRFAVWSIGLTSGELMYVGNGGYPPSVRPSNPTALVQYLDLATDTLDTGPNHYAQTVTGTTLGAAAPNLLGPLQAMERPENIALVCHRGGTTHVNEMYLAECTDRSGTAFEFRPAYAIPPSGEIFRDGDIFYQASTKTWWAGCINESTNGVSSTWSLYTSANGNEFTWVMDVDCSAITGTGSGKRTWKPRFIQDEDNVHVLVALASTGQPAIYEMHPMAPNDLAGAWSTPVKLTGSALGSTSYDMQPFKIGQSYFMIYTDWKDFPNDPGSLNIEIVNAPQLTGPYNTKIVDGGSVGWGASSQGPCIFQRYDGRWIVYLDEGTAGTLYSLSSSSILGTATWSAPAQITIHGTDFSTSGFYPEGATVHRILAPETVNNTDADFLSKRETLTLSDRQHQAAIDRTWANTKAERKVSAAAHDAGLDQRLRDVSERIDNPPDETAKAVIEGLPADKATKVDQAQLMAEIGKIRALIKANHGEKTPEQQKRIEQGMIEMLIFSLL